MDGTIITAVGEQNLTAFWWMIGVVGFLALVAIGIGIFQGIDYGLDGDDIALLFFSWAAISVFVVLLGGVLPSSAYHNQTQNREQVAQLERIGFDNVDLDGSDYFTGSYDGDYFSGYLLPLEDDRYQIVEVKQ